ncbi:hypothetical protein SUGI_0621640 [Cryptomeria japonica]|nr:hypothetical protein SUGI_0621640 [Cryptomeria japonica]
MLSQRDEEVFRGKKREFTGFKFKLTHYTIMSQVSAVLEIPKSRFMILVREGALIIYKSYIRSAHYFNTYKEMLDQKELDILNQFIKDKGIDMEKERATSREAMTPVAPSWEMATNVPPAVDPPFGAFDMEQAECSNNIVGSWD